MPPSRKRRRRGKKGGGSQGPKPKSQPTRELDRSPLGLLSAAFVACGRCSHFFSGYWALVARARMVEVAAMQADNWLTLPFAEGLPLLIEKSYGVDILSDVVRVEAMCKQCNRTFVYAYALEEDGTIADAPPTMRIQVKPKRIIAPDVIAAAD